MRTCKHTYIYICTFILYTDDSGLPQSAQILGHWTALTFAEATVMLCAGPSCYMSTGGEIQRQTWSF